MGPRHRFSRTSTWLVLLGTAVLAARPTEEDDLSLDERIAAQRAIEQVFSVAGLAGWATSDIAEHHLTALPRLFWHGVPVYLLCWAIAYRAATRNERP